MSISTTRLRIDFWLSAGVIVESSSYTYVYRTSTRYKRRIDFFDNSPFLLWNRHTGKLTTIHLSLLFPFNKLHEIYSYLWHWIAWFAYDKYAHCTSFHSLSPHTRFSFFSGRSEGWIYETWRIESEKRGTYAKVIIFLV